MKWNRWLIALGGIFTVCLACIFILFIGSIISPAAGTPTSTTVNAEIIIAQTAQMASTQTALAIVPTAVITSTNLPTLTQPPVTPPTAIETIPITPLPTLAIVNFPTNTMVFILPTNPPHAGGTCSCSGDTLNCSDFGSQSSAQACFDYCVQQGAGDIHRLDRDNDNIACESN